MAKEQLSSSENASISGDSAKICFLSSSSEGQGPRLSWTIRSRSSQAGGVEYFSVTPIIFLWTASPVYQASPNVHMQDLILV